MEDLGIDAKVAVVREVAKLLPLPDLLASIKSDYVTQQQERECGLQLLLSQEGCFRGDEEHEQMSRRGRSAPPSASPATGVATVRVSDAATVCVQYRGHHPRVRQHEQSIENPIYQVFHRFLDGAGTRGHGRTRKKAGERAARSGRGNGAPLFSPHELICRGDRFFFGCASDFLRSQLCKRNTGCDVVCSWVLGTTIELDKLLSLDSEKERCPIKIRGFAEHNNVVLLSAVTGLFMVQLE